MTEYFIKRNLIPDITSGVYSGESDQSKIDAPGMKIDSPADKIDSQGSKIDSPASKIDAHSRSLEKAGTTIRL